MEIKSPTSLMTEIVEESNISIPPTTSENIISIHELKTQFKVKTFEMGVQVDLIKLVEYSKKDTNNAVSTPVSPFSPIGHSMLNGSVSN